MLPIAVESIDETMLAGLVTNQVAERRDLEFKRDLPGGKDEDIKEFLADVTSLANAQGGDLLFGIEDSGGIASALVGIEADDVDGEILRLDNIMRDGIEPRLAGTRTQWIALSSGRGVILIRIPASFAAPHRVRFKNSGRFFNRTSRGKYEMDVHELRNAFTQSEGLPQKFRLEHDAAVAGAHGHEIPISVANEPTAVATFLPTGLFREWRELPVNQENALYPVKPNEVSWMHTLEGFLIHTPLNKGTVRSYAHTHRNGRVDIVWTFGSNWETPRGVQQLCWPDRFEQGLLGQATSAQAKFRALGVDEPWVVLVTVFGINGFRLVLSQHHASEPAWRDGATLPQLVLEQMNEQGLKRIFKAFWLLFGEERPDDRQIGPV